MAAAIVVGSVSAHAGAGNAIFAEADTGSHAAFFERAVLFIHVKFVGLRVVGDDDVRPAVVVVIENCNSEALGRRIAQACFLRRIFKFAVAKVVPQANRRAFVRFRSAVRLVRAIERAVEVALLAPLHIIGDDQIEFAVAIVVNPSSAGREFVRTPHAGGLCHLGKGAVSVVVKQMALAERSDEDIVEAVVVVVADRQLRSRTWELPARLGESRR